MPHLFIPDHRVAEEGASSVSSDPALRATSDWYRIAFDDDSAVAVRDGALTLVDARQGCDDAEAYLTRAAVRDARRGDEGAREASDGDDDWLLLARGEVAQNGRALVTRIARLADRDELRIAGQSAFVSFECEAEIVPWGGDEPRTCARCRTPIVPGQPSVTCPERSCGVVHHEDAAGKLPCWTCDERCAVCSQATSLDGGLSFDPGDL